MTSASVPIDLIISPFFLAGQSRSRPLSGLLVGYAFGNTPTMWGVGRGKVVVLELRLFR
jgi:hypothetical protein